MTNLQEQIKEAIAEADRILEKLKRRVEKEAKKNALAIIEDNELAAQELQTIFGNKYNIRIFHNAKGALEALQVQTVDAAILDLTFLDGCGFEVLRRLKNVNPELPVHVHTGQVGDYPGDEIKEATNAFEGIEDTDSTEKLKEFTKTAAEIYQDLKVDIIQNLIEDFSKGAHCKYSAVFDQNEDRLLTYVEMMTMSFKHIVKEECLMPFCYISNDLSRIREEENKGLCPFHLDLDPLDKPKRYNTGHLSSYQCTYYQYATLGKIERRILDALEKKKDLIKTRPRKPINLLRQRSKKTADDKKFLPESPFHPKIELTETTSMEPATVHF